MGWLYRVFMLYALKRCPKCKCYSIGCGQWNDVCFNPKCPEPSPYPSQHKSLRQMDREARRSERKRNTTPGVATRQQ